MTSSSSTNVFDTNNCVLYYYYVTVFYVCVNLLLVGGALTRIEDEPGTSNFHSLFIFRDSPRVYFYGNEIFSPVIHPHFRFHPHSCPVCHRHSVSGVVAL